MQYFVLLGALETHVKLGAVIFVFILEGEQFIEVCDLIFGQKLELRRVLLILIGNLYRLIDGYFIVRIVIRYLRLFSDFIVLGETAEVKGIGFHLVQWFRVLPRCYVVLLALVFQKVKTHYD